MQKKGANISLKGYDDIFSTDQSRAEAQQERVQEIPLSELHPVEGHPFRGVDDEEIMKSFLVTGGTGHRSLRVRKPCLRLFVTWTMMQPLF